METIKPEECLVCRKHRGQVAVAGGPIYQDELIFVSHAQLWGDEREHYLGHLFIEPKRHVAELADLSDAEAQRIGLFTTRSARALIDTEGAEHIYAFVIGDGVPHVHVHVIGRYPGAPRQYWGSRVDEWPDAPHGAEREITEVAARVRRFLEAASIGETPQGPAARAGFADPSDNRLGPWEEKDMAEEETPAELVLIPGGEFRMGTESEGDHSPVHQVRLDPFYVDRHEVTNAQYQRFCQATGHRLPEFWGMSGFRCGPDYPNHPVVGVSWRDAADYAAWCGKRLPTEAEWEYAARGGLAGMDFPNGDSLDPSEGNYNKSGKGGPVVVGSYRANGFGLHDMQGNVVEWVADFYDAAYYASSPAVNPQGPERGRFRVIRGGGWHSGASCNKVSYRNALPPNWVDFNVGFRCVKDME